MSLFGHQKSTIVGLLESAKTNFKNTKSFKLHKCQEKLLKALGKKKKGKFKLLSIPTRGESHLVTGTSTFYKTKTTEEILNKITKENKNP